MRIAKTVSITLPPDLLVKAQTLAEREHRTMSELFREALRRYMTDQQATAQEQWADLFEYGWAKGRELGITSEADVERMSDEYRASKRA
jgi:predicted transcriptional regulator